MSKKATEKYINQLLGVEEPFSSAVEKTSPLSVDQQKFIDAYTTNGGITKSALRSSGVPRASLERWKTEDQEFKKAMKIAEEHWVEELRKAAFMRAQAKSDVLLMFLLKAMKPEEFDDDVRKTQYVGLNSNPDNIPVRATLVRDNNILVQNISLGTEQSDRLRDILKEEEALELQQPAEEDDPMDPQF
jgi:hypothetical protein